MPIVTTPYYKERLEEAFKASGLTWKTVSETTEIPASTLYAYKNGKNTPNVEQLEKLGAALDVPASYFMKPISESAKLVGPRLFRASSSLTQKQADFAESQLSRMSECVDYASHWLELPKADFLREFDELGDPASLEAQDIEVLALRVREKLGFGKGPINNLIRALEKAGIPVLRQSIVGKKNIDGLSQHAASGQPLCAVFAKEEPCLSREYFSLAHELGHIVMHSKVDEARYQNLAFEKQLEDQANRFASAFLLPSEQFLSELFAPTLKAFEYLKRKWRASIAAMIRRCYDLGVINRSRYSSLNVQLSQKRWRTKEPLDDEFEVEEPIYLKRVFETLVSREGLVIEDIVSDLSIPSRELSHLSGLSLKFFEPDRDLLEFSPATNGKG